MSTDADQAQREAWSRAAQAWERWQPALREGLGPVSQWMVDALDPRPGERLLELAAGPGETGFIAAQRLGSDGHLLSTDQSPEMVEVAKRRAAELGLQNVDFAVVDAQQMDFEPESFDGVLCRFGYMLMTDADAALSGTRRALRAGGRLAMAVWDTPDRNLWMSAPVIQLVARGAMPPPDPTTPTPFSMADQSALSDRLRAAGFTAVETEGLEFTQTYPSLDVYWEVTTDLAAPIRAAIEELDEAKRADVLAGVRETLRSFEADDGSLNIPACAVVAKAQV
jgi:ubiquinone/menaquinone biosynthesis C-methylase UbiE